MDYEEMYKKMKQDQIDGKNFDNLDEITFFDVIGFTLTGIFFYLIWTNSKLPEVWQKITSFF